MNKLIRLSAICIATAGLLPLSTLTNASDEQGTGSVDGNYLKPPTESFLSISNWSYRFEEPANWPPVTLDTSAQWQMSDSVNSFHSGGFSLGDPDAYIPWPSDSSDVWVQSTFSISQDDINKVMLWGRWDDHISVFINGIEAVKRDRWASSQRYLGISEAARASIMPNSPNTLAVHVRDLGGGKHLTIDLVKTDAMANLAISADANNNHFAPIIQYMHETMSQYGVSAGAISIGKVDGSAEIALTANIGYMNKDFTQPLPDNAIFRLGSLDKFPAEWLVRRMVDMGVTNPSTGAPLQLTSEVFPILHHLGLMPLSTGIADSRVNDITFQHLIDHKSGLPGGIPFDSDFYQSLGITSDQLTREHNIRWLYSQPLQTAPGAVQGYENTAFDLLRYAIDEIAPGGLEQFLQQQLFPVSDHSMYIAIGPMANRLYGSTQEAIEPWYTTFVEDDDALEIGSIGVLAASAESYTKYHLERLGNGIYYGATDGVATAKRKFPLPNGDTVGFTVMFNMRDSVPFSDDGVDGTIEKMILALPEEAWSSGSAGIDCNLSAGTWRTNTVTNCSFAIANATNWSVGSYHGASAWPNYSNQELRVNINSPGSEHWHVQAVTPVNLQEAGSYVVSFRARAQAPRDMVINLGHNGSQDNNWTSYGQKTVRLDTEMRAYTLTLSDIPMDPNSRLDFNMGAGGTADIIIDDVYLAPSR